MSLGDIKTAIIAFVNKALNKSYSGTGLDIALQTCLNDMANANLLVAQDASQTLSSGDTILAYPTDFKDLISIILIDGNSNELEPLKKLPEGHTGYRELRNNDSSSGDTEWFAEFNRTFELWRPANQSYTSKIDYYRYHPQTPANILFADDFRNAVYFGTTYWEAVLLKLPDHIATWFPIYEREKEMRRLNMPVQPAIVRG